MVHVANSDIQGKIANMYWGNQWEMIGLPIRGEYDDYGYIDNIDKGDYGNEFHHEILVPSFAPLCPPASRHGEITPLEVFTETSRTGTQVLPTSWLNSYHTRKYPGIEFTSSKDYKDVGTWKPGEEILEDHAYELRSTNGSIVSKLFMHEAAYDKLIEIGMNVSYYPDYTPVDIKPHALALLTDLKHQYLNPIEMEYVAGMSEEDFDLFNKVCNMRAFLRPYFKVEDAWNTPVYAFAKFIDSNGEGSEGRDINRNVTAMFRQIFATCWEEGDSVTEERLLDALIEYYYFKMGLTQVGRDLTPKPNVTGQHRQNDNMEATIEYLETCIKIQKGFLTEREEW